MAKTILKKLGISKQTVLRRKNDKGKKGTKVKNDMNTGK